MVFFLVKQAKTIKKRSQQQLNDNAKVDLAYVALEGLCAAKAFVEVAIVPIQSHTDQIVGLMVESLCLAAGKMEPYASLINLACSNTVLKKCTIRSHQMLEMGSR